jgi:hypothetical protein
MRQSVIQIHGGAVPLRKQSSKGYCVAFCVGSGWFPSGLGMLPQMSRSDVGAEGYRKVGLGGGAYRELLRCSAKVEDIGKEMRA